MADRENPAKIGLDSVTLSAFARMINTTTVSLIADQNAAAIFSRLLIAQDLGDNVHVKNLTNGARCSTTSMLRRIAQLERDGLIRRVSDPEDGRSKLVTLTLQGRAAILRSVCALRSSGFSPES